jgi:A/G-specific adenine glycosylase
MKKLNQDYWVQVLLEWFTKNKRTLPWRIERTPYKVWVSEIMLQQTRVNAVIPYYQRFMERFPSIESLGDSSLEDVYKLWEGLGYYSRAKNMVHSARLIVEKYHGVFPVAYQDIVSLPGVGDYTAGAIMSLAFNKPYPAIDGNVLRFISRLNNDFSDITESSYRKKVKEMIQGVYPHGQARNFTEALMEFGSLVCVPAQPICPECPLREFCAGYKAQNQLTLPVKKKKTKSVVIQMSVAVVEYSGKVLLVKREETGMLANLYGYPLFSVYSKTSFLKELNDFLSQRQIPTSYKATYRGIVEHEYSHQIWKSKIYSVKINHLDDIKKDRFESIEKQCVKDGIKNENSGEEKWMWVKETETDMYPISRFYRKVERVVREKRDRGDSNSRSPA